MILTDTHTHLYLEEFDNDRDEVFERAHAAGVSRFFLPNINSQSLQPMLDVAARYDNAHPMIGLHPCYVKENYKEELALVQQELEMHLERGYAAVGEIGMDLYWDKSFVKEQEIALRTQVEWAKEYDLPVVLHTRDAFDEIFAVMDELNDHHLTGIFHCFTGTVEQALHIMGYGDFYIGIGGVLTYKNAGLDAVLKKLPLERMVLETDAPYLTPVPHRGKRNETSYTRLVAEKLAEVKGVSLEDVAVITTANSKAVFKI